MLQFFRYYQKFLFTVIAIVISLSFLFSGSYVSFLSNRMEEPSPFVATLIDGSKITQKELAGFVRFISTEKQGKDLSSINVWNEGLLANYLFALGLEERFYSLRKDTYDAFYEDLWEKISQYQPYVHAKAPFIRAEGVWSSFAPEINEKRKSLPNKWDKTALKTLADLYQEEQKFPAEMLRRVLRYYEKEARVEPDPRLRTYPLGLFGFSSPKAWFPPEFFQDAALFFMNTAKQAIKTGCTISRSTIEEELQKALFAYLPKEGVDPEAFSRGQLAALGLQEKQLFSLMETLLLATKYIDSLGQSAFLDPKLFYPLVEDQLEMVTVKKRSMAEDAVFTTHKDYALFALYKMAVSPSQGKYIDQYFPIDVIKKKYPKLVSSSYKAFCSFVSLQECASNLPLQEIWAWQAKDDGYALLQKRIKTLPPETSPEKRLEHIDLLPPDMKKIALDFSKKKMMQNREDLIVSTLEKKPKKELYIQVFADGSLTGLQIGKSAKLQKLLAKAPLQGQIDLTVDELKAQEELYAFSPDGEGFFQIAVVEKGKEELLTFKKAKHAGALEPLFQEHMQEMRPIVEKTHPKIFSLKDSKVQEEHLAKALFPCKDIAGYFASHIEACRSSSSTYADTVDQQWQLATSEEKIEGKEKAAFLSHLSANESSSVIKTPFPAIYTLLKRDKKDLAELPEFIKAKKALQQEAKKESSHQLWKSFHEKGLFCIE